MGACHSRKQSFICSGGSYPRCHGRWTISRADTSRDAGVLNHLFQICFTPPAALFIKAHRLLHPICISAVPYDDAFELSFAADALTKTKVHSLLFRSVSDAVQHQSPKASLPQSTLPIVDTSYQYHNNHVKSENGPIQKCAIHPDLLSVDELLRSRLLRRHPADIPP